MTFVAVCLLALEGCGVEKGVPVPVPAVKVQALDAAWFHEDATPTSAVPGSSAPLDSTVSVMGDAGIQEARQAQAVQKVAKATSYIEADADDLGELVKRRRLVRLEHFAAKNGWNTWGPPEVVVTNPQVQVWWEEWRDLRVAQETSALKDRVAVQPKPEEAASPPPQMAAPQ